MNHYRKTLDLALGRHGYFTAIEARQSGIRSCELVRWVKSGRLENPARGVYRVSDYPPSPIDPYILAVLSVGKDAVLYGESVLGVLNLASTNPLRIYVASPAQLRRKLGGGIKVIKVAVGTSWNYEGLPLQEVSDAIRSSRGVIYDDRRMAAAREAKRQGYISRAECLRLEREIRNEATA